MLAKHPPSAGFPSPSEGAAPSAPPLVASGAHLGNQKKNKTHIWNPHETGQVFKTIWGAAGTPFFLIAAAPSGAPRAP